MGACSECVFPEHSRPIQPVASLTAIQVALNTMFVKHDGYRADGAAVQISFLYQFFTFTLTGYRITERVFENTIKHMQCMKDLQMLT